MALSDFDPTDGGGNWATGAASGFAVGGPVGALAGAGLGALSDLAGGAARRRRRAAEQAARERQAYYDRLGEEIRGVATAPETQERAGAIFEPAGREIDRGMYQGVGGTARAFSGRGVTGGYSAAGQRSIVSQAAEERARGRAAAFDQALTEGQRSILQQAQLSHLGDPLLQQMLQGAYGSDAAATASGLDFQNNALKAGLGAAGRKYGTPAGYGDASTVDPYGRNFAAAPPSLTPEGEDGWDSWGGWYVPRRA